MVTDSPMTEAEYENMKRKIDKDHDDALLLLGRTYAAGNRKYQVGDILKSHQGDIIKVERISWSLGIGKSYPECVYVGKELRKDLQPKKLAYVRHIPQSRIATRIEPK